MSVTVDANILIYGSNESDPAHQVARTLVENLAAGPDIVYLFWPVIMAYLRIVTSSVILPRPLDFAVASANVAQLLALRHVRSPGEDRGFWEVFGVAAGVGMRSDLVTDGHIVALMKQHGVAVIYTRDRDFRRFDGITQVDPFHL